MLAALAAELFDVDAEAVPLPGEVNRNARLDVGGRPRYLLKVYAAETSPAEIALQEAVMGHLAHTGSAVQTAALVGANTATVAGQKRTVHLLRWVPGTPWSQAGPADGLKLGKGRLLDLTVPCGEEHEVLVERSRADDGCYELVIFDLDQVHNRCSPRLAAGVRYFVCLDLEDAAAVGKE